MSKIKNKNLLKLNKMIETQKKKFGFEPNLFSYKFDYRSKRLTINYTIPTQVYESGKLKVLMKHAKPIYLSDINETNFETWFKGNTSVFADHITLVRQKKEEAYKTTKGKGDKESFANWVETFYKRNPNLSEETIKQNKLDCNRYMTWVTNKYESSSDAMTHSDMGKDWVLEWLKFMTDTKGWKGATYRRAYRNVKGLYNYIAESIKEFPYDILRGIKLPPENSKKDSLNSREFDKVVKFINDNKDKADWNKFILMLRLQMTTGMRIGEIVNIKNDDIETDNKRIWITGKGNQERKLNFGSKHDKELWKDILKKKSEGDEDGYLFYRSRRVTIGGELTDIDINKSLPTTDSYYQDRFSEMRDKLRLRGKGIITSHSLRRYFITKFVNKTGQRDLARQIVGHKTTRMTDYYMADLIEEDTETTIDIGI